MDDIVLRYKELNTSFERELVYHVGIDAGFFAEYTYMLNAMLWCLQHKIRFKLYSDDANFSYEKGWNDYFEPFCEEVHEHFHHRFNVHRIPSWGKLLSQKDFRILKWKLKCNCLNFIGDWKALKCYHKHVLLNHHICFDFNEHFYIPELGIDGDYFHAFKVVVNITWRLNKQIREESFKLEEELRLPNDYIGCQIRGGDKITETELLSPDCYIRLIEKANRGKNVFVLTDDYRIFEELQSKAPVIKWYTLCSSLEKGYVNSAFSRKGGNKKRNQMVRFLASMEILMRSSFFLGSITTGPSLFLLKWGFPHYQPVDCLLDQFKMVATLPIAKRSEVSEKFIKNLAY